MQPDVQIVSSQTLPPAVELSQQVEVSSSAPLQAAVALSNVSKWYERGTSQTQVLEDVTLTVDRGECVFLLGPSGSGKTTLLSIIGCVLTADEGEVRVLDYDVGGLDSAGLTNLRRKHIGFVFQRFHLIQGLSALENVCVPLVLSGWDHELTIQRGLELLVQVGLSEKTHVVPKELSVGQCQRVAIARALAADPDLILADEPTASLDAETGQRAMQLLQRLTVKRGKTVIVVTHDPRILPFADRVVEIQNGRLAESPGFRTSTQK